MIRIANLTRRFGTNVAVDHISLEISKGEIFGLVGPDGAGKTTTLRMICGLIEITEGRAEIDGLDVSRSLDPVKDRIGYMAQRFGLYPDLTVEENMYFYSDLFGVYGDKRDKLMSELLDTTRMAQFRRRPAGKLSGGMKQKLALMCTLLHFPKVLILDEPTNGVDPVSRRDFWDILYALAKDGMTIFVTTAYLDEAERCGRVGLMHKGRLICVDTPVALKALVEPYSRKVEAPDLREARVLLNRRPEVLSAEPAGAALHVYLKQPEFDNASLPREVNLAPLNPSLEDVFIAMVRAEECGARFSHC